ncbi:MAG: hypothetical protein BGO77_00040 [Caedibacter sp. 37-49]|nr:MAG: hypothetical protein BGO77_00040 [Caedibacter sp. 37-49]
MSGQSGNEKNHEHRSKMGKRQHQVPRLNSKDFYYERLNERRFRHSRWALRHRRNMEEREQGETSNLKVFVGVFYFEIKKINNNSTKVNVANQSLTKKMEKTSKSVNKKSCTSRKKILRQSVKKVPLELVPSKLERHLKLC